MLKTPKVLHEVGNYPMLFHVLDTANLLKSKICLVISNSLLKFKELLKKYKNLDFLVQNQQKVQLTLLRP